MLNAPNQYVTNDWHGKVANIPDGLLYFNDFYFRDGLFVKRHTWARAFWQARLRCIGYGARLPSLSRQAEMAFTDLVLVSGSWIGESAVAVNTYHEG